MKRLGLFSLYRTALEAIVVIQISLMMATIGIGVIFRYILKNPLTWTDELSQFLLIWTISIGSVVAHWRGLHPNMDMIMEKLSGFSKIFIKTLVDSIVLGVMVCILIYGVRTMDSLRFVRSAALNFPLLYINAAIPVSMALMIPYQCFLIMNTLLGKSCVVQK